MPHYKYLIVGAGMTADAAARGIRETDRDGSIGMIGGEGHPPYDRPPLTKKLWKGKPLDIIWRGTLNLGVELHLGRDVQVVDPKNPYHFLIRVQEVTAITDKDKVLEFKKGDQVEVFFLNQWFPAAVLGTNKYGAVMVEFEFAGRPMQQALRRDQVRAKKEMNLSIRRVTPLVSFPALMRIPNSSCIPRSVPA